MKTLEGLKQLLQTKHSEEYANKLGMVYQVWEDGEITVQKSGPLLNLRTLHLVEFGLNKSVPKNIMPIEESEHGFAYTENRETANEIREYIKELINNGILH